MALKTLLYEKSDAVANIVLNRPDVLNAMNSTMRRELLQVVDDFSSDAEIRAAVITGAGRAFCAGTDVAEFEGSDFPPTEDIVFRQVMRGLENSPKPIFAVINGFALGGGLEFALGCDFRIASNDAELGLVEVGIGLIPGGGGTQRLPRVVGVSKAKELIFTGRRIKADEALSIGLVSAVAPKEKLGEIVASWINGIKDKAPVAIASAKFAINKVWEGARLDDGLVFEREYANLNYATEDRAEGISAFREKRKPNFKGM